MNTTQTDYHQQGIDFLNDTQTVMNVTFLKVGKHFEDDKENRDIYEIELKRNKRSYKFNFGQSIQNSGKYILHDARLKAEFGRSFISEAEAKKLKTRMFPSEFRQNVPLNKNFAQPTAYDVLCCLTKYDPGTFDDFCSDFGYDTDSRKAEKTYNAVREEYLQVSRLFNESELSKMAEIQ